MEIRIQKRFSYLLLILVLVTSFPLYASSPIKAQEQNYNKASTNQLTKEVNISVERLSDVEVVVKGPNDVIPDSLRNLRTRADSNGKANVAIPLGTQKDDPSICSPSLERGLGESDEFVLR